MFSLSWFDPILDIHWEFHAVVISTYLVCPLSFLLYLRFRRSNVISYSSRTPFLGIVIRALLIARKKVKNLLLKFIVPSGQNWEWRRKTINQTATESFSICVVFVSGLFIYEYGLFGPNGIYKNIIRVSASDYGIQLQALGSLTLAYEAVIAASYQLRGHSGLIPQSTRLRQELRQTTKRYTLRFTGAFLLTLGYSFELLLQAYTKYIEDFGWWVEPIWVLLAVVVLIIGIERTLTQVFAVTCVIFLPLYWILFWNIYHPAVAFVALVLFILLYQFEKRNGYPGIYYLILGQYRSNKS